ncbi:hypothetical protein, conserved in T. vivax [Trypanosoma vivax Y486]|uniref:Uncharacterized protein n=1 Tax=Trypanosoma vivax (strain Y486) TaxID=1055687 RepID=F9WSB8_TRYVY|nr:hypothetical protein, conserved in T. vivax [Trypanosoma vivax Y486]|eukprot:CCD20457.1 hypothetical protein, conserved in T. vivax [Trypanosoma vivax Y486]
MHEHREAQKHGKARGQRNGNERRPERRKGHVLQGAPFERTWRGRRPAKENNTAKTHMPQTKRTHTKVRVASRRKRKEKTAIKPHMQGQGRTQRATKSTRQHACDTKGARAAARNSKQRG